MKEWSAFGFQLLDVCFVRAAVWALAISFAGARFHTSHIQHPTSQLPDPNSQLPHHTSHIIHPTSHIPHQTFLKNTVSSIASMMIGFDLSTVPARSSFESWFSTLRCITRFTGRAPNSGSKPAREILLIASSVFLFLSCWG